MSDTQSTPNSNTPTPGLLDSVTHLVSDATNAAKEKLTEAATAAKEKLGEAAESASHLASDAVTAAKEAVGMKSDTAQTAQGGRRRKTKRKSSKKQRGGNTETTPPVEQNSTEIVTGGGNVEHRAVGSMAEVMHGIADHTPGGLHKSDLMYNKYGRIVSKKQHKAGIKAIGRLYKAGYKPKKGSFKPSRKSSSSSTKKNKKTTKK